MRLKGTLSTLTLAASLFLLASAGCSAPEGRTPDAGFPDAGFPDAGFVDGGLADAGTARACSATDPRQVPAQVAVFPDEGQTPYVSMLSRAQDSIKLMVYLMGRGGILDTLKQKAGEGKRVQVILDGQQASNEKYYDELADAGVNVAWSNPTFTYSHAKMFIVDDREAFLSSGNYAAFAIERERNFGVALSDPQDVADLLTVFSADWERTDLDLNCTRLVISPTNASTRIIELINSAEQELMVESMQLAESNVRQAITVRHNNGVNVRVLLADPSWIDANQAAADYLSSRGIPARWLATPPVHAKAIIVDGKLAFVGSENLSFTSLNRNRELGVVVSESAGVAAMAAAFETDWLGAQAF